MTRLFDKLFIAVTLLLLLGFGACRENEAPQVLVDEPEEQFISLADSVLLSCTISDDHDLHEFYLVIKNVNGDTIINEAPYVHGLQTLKFSYRFMPADTGDYRVHFTAVDHDLEIWQEDVLLKATFPTFFALARPADSAVVINPDSFFLSAFISDKYGLDSLFFTGVSYANGDTAFNLVYDLTGLTTFTLNRPVSHPDTGAFYLNAAVSNVKELITRKVVRYYVH